MLKKTMDRLRSESKTTKIDDLRREEIEVV
jgi:hypothetical protein